MGLIKEEKLDIANSMDQIIFGLFENLTIDNSYKSDDEDVLPEAIKVWSVPPVSIQFINILSASKACPRT
jgi:hypothetical protein